MSASTAAPAGVVTHRVGVVDPDGNCSVCGRPTAAPYRDEFDGRNRYGCVGRPHDGLVPTTMLRPGDVVDVWLGTLRTVAEVVPTGWLNANDVPILEVLYLEGRTPEWGAGNTAIGSTGWTVVRVGGVA